METITDVINKRFGKSPSTTAPTAYTKDEIRLYGLEVKK